MLESTIARKGQVTIRKAIRDRLGVSEGEKVYFVMRGDEVVLKVIRDTILDLRGSVRPPARPDDPEHVRRAVRLAVGRKAAAGE